ncbi:MAG: LysE family transporter [Saprospiraceae bacterium]
MDLLLQGIKIGLVLCFMIGPVFFTLLQTAIEEGFRASAVVGLGIWTSDMGYILLAYFGLTIMQQYMDGNQLDIAIGILGSVLFLIFGLISLLVPPKNLLLPDDQLYQRSSSYLSLYIKGFLLNAFNPFTIILWLGIGTTLIDEALSPNRASLFFGAILGTVVLTDLLKIVLSKRIRKVMQPKHLIWLRKGVGIVLLGFGVFLAIRTFTLI